jgi:hypothetical protein
LVKVCPFGNIGRSAASDGSWKPSPDAGWVTAQTRFVQFGGGGRWLAGLAVPRHWGTGRSWRGVESARLVVLSSGILIMAAGAPPGQVGHSGYPVSLTTGMGEVADTAAIGEGASGRLIGVQRYLANIAHRQARNLSGRQRQTDRARPPTGWGSFPIPAGPGAPDTKLPRQTSSNGTQIVL